MPVLMKLTNRITPNKKKTKQKKKYFEKKGDEYAHMNKRAHVTFDVTGLNVQQFFEEKQKNVRETHLS